MEASPPMVPVSSMQGQGSGLEESQSRDYWPGVITVQPAPGHEGHPSPVIPSHCHTRVLIVVSTPEVVTCACLQ